MSYGAVLLDVGGVFLVPHGDPVASALADVGIGIEEADFVRSHYCGIGGYDRDAGDGQYLPRYLTGYVEALGIRAEDRGRAIDALVTAWRMSSVDIWRQVLSDSVRGLQRIAARKIPIGIVSNSDGTVEEQLRRHGICQVGPGLGIDVAIVVDSSVIGVAKPDPRAFAPAIAALGLPADEVAFVGDSVLIDVLGAEKSGLQPIHFDPYRICNSSHQHRHIRSLFDLSIWI